MSKKKSSDIGMFIIGWIASALAIAVPIMTLVLIEKYYNEFYLKYDSRINIIAYLVGAFFSGLFTAYRVSCKSDEKDATIKELTDQIDESKKAYNTLSPKSKIISILHELHTSSEKLSKPEVLKLIMRKIGEINKDSSLDPRYDGMISQINDDEFKDGKTSSTGTSSKNKNTPQGDRTPITFKKRPGVSI